MFDQNDNQNITYGNLWDEANSAQRKTFEVMSVNKMYQAWGGVRSGDRVHGLSNTSLTKFILQIVPEDM